ERAGRVLAGPLGRFLYTRLNFSPRVILPLAWANKATLTPALRHAYMDAFPRPADRFGAWGFARVVLGASAWFDALWARRDRIAHLPTLLLWGMRDPAITPRFLDRWRTLFPTAQVVEFLSAGHFVQEEAPEEALKALEVFLVGVQEGAVGAP
ncbi:MAG: alpha/beta fold hydrolase, partial [Chloroflexales bacterium]|nr:alpha/beta fold hydrolase [Chloroflexales bacterium]